jgi:hypoxanthine phosphoribosyltransferase
VQIEFEQKKMHMRTLFSAQQIQSRVKEIVQQINQDFNSQELLVVLIVLNGSFIFAADLVRHLNMPIEIETVRLKSYEGTNSSGKIKMLNPMSFDLSDKQVLIIEDIVETGYTLQFLLEEIKAKNAKSVKICTLLNKPQAHEISIQPDYVGFDIGKNFIVGYGLDLDGKYRNLPFIAELT